MILFVAYAPLGALKANDDDDDINHNINLKNLTKKNYKIVADKNKLKW